MKTALEYANDWEASIEEMRKSGAEDLFDHQEWKDLFVAFLKNRVMHDAYLAGMNDKNNSKLP